MSAALNGWTAERLDDLARDVSDLRKEQGANMAEIRKELGLMRSQEIQDLKDDLADAQTELSEARNRPRAALTAYLAPLLAGLIPTLVLLLHG